MFGKGSFEQHIKGSRNTALLDPQWNRRSTQEGYRNISLRITAERQFARDRKIQKDCRDKQITSRRDRPTSHDLFRRHETQRSHQRSSTIYSHPITRIDAWLMCKSEIQQEHAIFSIVTGLDKHVFRREIPMNDACGMNCI